LESEITFIKIEIKVPQLELIRLKTCEPVVVGLLRRYYVHHKPNCKVVKEKIKKVESKIRKVESQNKSN